ncbi:MAG: SDR family oxidoreductase [Alphaproteobacteria bacterium]
MPATRPTKNKALIAGVTGIVGGHLAGLLAGAEDWDIAGISRRAPKAGGAPFAHIALDLADAAACREAAADLGDVTHIFYAARLDRADPAAEADINRTMLANLIEAVAPRAGGLAHVQLVHGTKWYGNHLGTYKTPAREDDPRHMPPNFYFAQHDWLRDYRAGKPWSWSTLRPHTVYGIVTGQDHNLILLLAAYAAVSKELGLPLRFPGSQGRFDSVAQATDAGLLAKAMLWAATTPGAADRDFNIVNGDPFRWRHVWPRIAANFDMEAGPVQPLDLARFMADKAPLWDRIVAKYDLRPTPFADLGNWGWANGILSPARDDISSMIKARKLGFHEVEDNEAMFTRLFAELRARRYIPAAEGST